MNHLILSIAAAFFGVATADMFSRGWTGVLRTAASFVLFFQKKISGATLFSRLNAAIPIAILCWLTMFLAFRFYFRVWGLGESELEQVGYFLGAVTRVFLYLKQANRLIETLFDAGNDP
ncbi:hypothetical protein [Desulfovibrio sp. Fe33]|uniref:hypothetical protein n=1 Tax=Desulfovibrio sp. Fe33 TaxID=3020842 RepID=UPI00234C7B60|nr:hypothetical protein [Desulfovibrio sp. Fe33]